MKLKPITILIIIVSLLILLFSVTTIKKNTKKNENTEIQISSLDESGNDTTNVSKKQKEKVQDVYDHLMDEDWEYLWKKMLHYENEILTVQDLKYYFKSEIRKTDVDEGNLKLSEQGYELNDIGVEDDGEYGDLIVFSISNGYSIKRFGLYEKGSSKENYELLLDTDFSSRDYVGGEEADFRGNAVIFPKELEDIKIRDIKLDDKFIDSNFFKSVNMIEEIESSINENEEINDYSNYKVYRLVLPMKTLSFNEELAKTSKEEYGVDIGTPGKLTVTANTSKYGEMYSPDGITLDSFGSDDMFAAKYGFTAKFYLKSDEGKEKILNGLKDTLNGILQTYEETGTYLSDDYRKFFVDEFSDKGYKDVTEKMESSLANSDSKWSFKSYNIRVNGVIAEDDKICYLGNNVFSFVPGTATKWERETDSDGNTTTKTCQSMSSSDIKIQVEEDGKVKIKEVSTSLFSRLCIMNSDFEWEY